MLIKNSISMSMELPFDEMAEKVLDAAWCDTPCVRVMCREEMTGRWTCTDEMTADEARKAMAADFKDVSSDCDYFVMSVNLDNVQVSCFLSDDGEGTVEVFGAPKDCVDYMESLVEED